MDDELIDELRMLRARAYGPDPDIHHDPCALARLQDLERLARGPEIEQLPPKPMLPAQTEPAVVVEPLLSAESPAPAEVEDEPVPSEPSPAPTRKWSNKRIAITWLASLTVAVLVTATVTGFVSRRIQADPREVAVLGIDALAAWPEFMQQSGAGPDGEPVEESSGEVFATFHGLTSYSTTDGWFMGVAGDPCLLILGTAQIEKDSPSFNGPIFTGCAAGGFPATVEIVVGTGNQDLPEELLEAFPDGTALQFVLDGDEVVVLSDED